jgi:phage gpG-like protein
MSGVGLTITLDGLEHAVSVVGRFEHLDEAALLTTIGAIGEMQTRRRIESEKTSPDGAPWKPNREGTSILLRSGEHLRDSIAFDVGAGLVRWGSSWEYAHVHQNGAVITAKGKALFFMSGGKKRVAKKVTIPARPFVGLSAANGVELDRVVTDFLGRLAR